VSSTEVSLVFTKDGRACQIACCGALLTTPRSLAAVRIGNAEGRRIVGSALWCEDG
jgi:hypothetical protein